MTSSASSSPPPPLLAVAFLASLGFSIVMPFLVFVVKGFGGNAFAMGVIAAAFSAAQLVGAPWLGRLSDRHGRKKILLYSQLGGLAAWVCFLVALYAPRIDLLTVDNGITGAFVVTLPLLLVLLSRSVDGLTNGSISVANAYLSDVTPADERKTAFGRLAAATSLGFVVGPAFAGTLAHSPSGTPLLVGIAIVLSAGGAFVVQRYLHDVPVSAPKTPPTTATHQALGGGPKPCVHVEHAPQGLRAVTAIPGVPALLVIYFLVYLGFSIFLAAFPFHALTILEWAPARLGGFYTALAVSLVVTQGVLLPALGRKVSAGWLASAGSLILAGAYALLVTKDATAAWGVAVLYGVGNGLMWPSFLSVFSRTGPSSLQGTLQGVGSSMGSLASIVGTLAGGALFGKLGAWTFVVSSGVLVLAAAALARVAVPAREA